MIFPFLAEENGDEGVILFCNYLSLGSLELARATFLDAVKLNADKMLAVLDVVIRQGPHRSWHSSRSAPCSAVIRWFCVTLLREAARFGVQPTEELPVSVIQEIEAELLLFDCFGDGARTEEDANEDSVLVQGRTIIAEFRRLLLERIQKSAKQIAAGHQAGGNGGGGSSTSSFMSGSGWGEPTSRFGEGLEQMATTLSAAAVSELRALLFDIPVLGKLLCDALCYVPPGSFPAPWALDVQRLVVDMANVLLDEKQTAEALRLIQALNFTSNSDSIVGADRLLNRLVSMLHANAEPVFRTVRRIGVRQTLLEQVMQSLYRTDNPYPLSLFFRYEAEAVCQLPVDALPLVVPILSASAAESILREDNLSNAHIESFVYDLFHWSKLRGEVYLDSLLEYLRGSVRRGETAPLKLVARLIPKLHSFFFLFAWQEVGEDITQRKRIMEALGDLNTDASSAAVNSDSELLLGLVKQLCYQLKTSWWLCGKLQEGPKANSARPASHSYLSDGRPLSDFESNSLGLATVLLDKLRTSSVLEILRGRVAFIPVEELRVVLLQRPCIGNEESAKRDLERDLDLIRAYQIASTAARLIQESGKLKSSDITAMEAAIADISSPSLLLQVLESLLCILQRPDAGADTMGVLLRPLRVGIELICGAESCTEDATVATTVINASNTGSRQKEVCRLVRELLFRHELVGRVNAALANACLERGWMAWIMMSPRSLGIQMLRARMYDDIPRLQRFFSFELEEFHSFRKFDSLKRGILGAEPSVDALLVELRSLDLPTALCVALDLALSPHVTGHRAPLLHAAEEILHRIRDQSSSHSAGSHVSHVLSNPRALTTLDYAMRSLSVYFSAFPHGDMETLFLQPFSLRGDLSPEEIKTELATVASLANAVEELRTAMRNLSQGTMHAEQFNEVIRNCRKTMLQSLSMTTGTASDGYLSNLQQSENSSAGDIAQPMRYVEPFLNYMIQLGQVLSRPSEHPVAYVSLLDETPSSILLRLVFRDHDFDRAQRLASLQRLDLVTFILKSLESRASDEGLDGGTPLVASADAAIVRYLSRRSKPLAAIAGLMYAPDGILPVDAAAFALDEICGTEPLASWVRDRAIAIDWYLRTFYPLRASPFVDLRASLHSAEKSNEALLPPKPIAAEVSAGTSPLHSGLAVALAQSPKVDQAVSPAVGAGNGAIPIPPPPAEASASYTASSVSSSSTVTLPNMSLSHLESAASSGGTGKTRPGGTASRAIPVRPGGTSSGSRGSALNQDRSSISGSLSSRAGGGGLSGGGGDSVVGSLSNSSYVGSYQFRRVAVGGAAGSHSRTVSGSSLMQSHESLDLGNSGALNAQDGRGMAVLLHRNDLASEIKFYQGIFDQLVATGRLVEALEVAELYLPDGAPDSLLQRLVSKPGADLTTAWEYVSRIRDAETAADLVLELRRHWAAEVCLNMLNMCQARLAASSPQRPRIEVLSAQLSVFSSILQIPGSRWRTWQQLEDECNGGAESVVRVLIGTHQQWDAARRVAELWSVEGIRLEIEEAYLSHLLERRDAAAVLQALRRLRVDEVIHVVENIVAEVTSYRTKRFLIQYVLSTYGNSLMPDVVARLTTKDYGVRVCTSLSTAMQGVYQPLLDRPHLILESIVMSGHVGLVETLLRQVPELRDDSMLARYAQKALVVPGADQADAFAPDYWLLTGDKDNDDETRNMHFYPGAPLGPLAKDLLGLCHDQRFAGQFCLGVCDNLSASLIKESVDGRAPLIALIVDMVTFAKVLFARDGRSADGVALCDSVLGHVEVLQHIIVTRANLSGFSLQDFRDKQKVLVLCDKLVEDDQMKLAIELASKCGLPTEPIWVEWALSLLDLGMYSEAKEKLKYCFSVKKKPHKLGSALVVASGGGDGVYGDRSSLLNQVLERLETRRGYDAGELRERFVELRRSAGGTFSESPSNATSGGAGNTLGMGLATPASSSFSAAGQAANKKSKPSLVSSLSGYLASSASALVSRGGSGVTSGGASGAAGAPHGSSSNLLNSSGAATAGVAPSPAADGHRDAGNSASPQFDPSFQYMQSIMFLKNYGNHVEMLRFWSRHGQYEDIASFLVSHEVSDEAFIEDVLMPAVRRGALSRLMTAVSNKDTGLAQTRHLWLACSKHLYHRKAYTVLLKLQIFVGDWSRAGMTCIRLGMKAEDTSAALYYLNAAVAHLSKELEIRGSPLGSIGGGDMPSGESPGELNKEAYSESIARPSAQLFTDFQLRGHLSTVKLSIEIIRELTAANAPPAVFSKSLFGPTNMKVELAQNLVVLGLFDLAFRVIQAHRLSASTVYCGAVNLMLGTKSYKQMAAAVRQIQGTVDDSDWESIVLSVIRGLADHLNDLKTAEMYINYLGTTRAKMEAYALVRKFKTAYLLAVQLQDLNFIQTIMERAQQHGDRGTAALCSKFLASFSS